MTDRRRLMIDENETIDIGTSVLWATGNICKDVDGNYYLGDTYESGCFFTWGNIDGYNYLSGRFDDNYEFNSNGYTSPGKLLTSDIDPNSSYDAAHVLLGGKWRMPTKSEFDELVNITYDTYWEPTDSHPNTGYREFYPKNSYAGQNAGIILPTTGTTYNNVSYYRDTVGIYWSSTYKNSSDAYALRFNDSDDQYAVDVSSYRRWDGGVIRPVMDKS